MENQERETDEKKRGDDEAKREREREKKQVGELKELQQEEEELMLRVFRGCNCIYGEFKFLLLFRERVNALLMFKLSITHTHCVLYGER